MVELRVHSDFLQNFYPNGKGKLANNEQNFQALFDESQYEISYF